MKFLLFCIFLILVKCNEIVKLNVGGKIFTTFRSTLESAGPDTYLYKLFNSEMSKMTLDSDGNIFLDHDPETFSLLLNLLRGYDVLKGKTVDEMTMLYQDANFFGMTDLMERIDQLPDEYVNTKEYRGGLKRKEKHGFGYGHKMDLGGLYTGDLLDGKKHGYGELAYNNGHKYTGEFANDQLVKGRYEISQDQYYDGEFQNNKPNGKGKDIWHDGRVYEGDYLDGNRHGKGKLYRKGYTYEGEFKDDLIHGRGKTTFDDGRVEEGVYVNEQYIGK